MIVCCMLTAIRLLMWCVIGLYIFFFFQAEDGIRDVAVTGVQTCALPIWLSDSFTAGWPSTDVTLQTSEIGSRSTEPSRSEERRVGKECRVRWAMGPYMKKEMSW